MSTSKTTKYNFNIANPAPLYSIPPKPHKTHHYLVSNKIPTDKNKYLSLYHHFYEKTYLLSISPCPYLYLLNIKFNN